MSLNLPTVLMIEDDDNVAYINVPSTMEGPIAAIASEMAYQATRWSEGDEKASGSGPFDRSLDEYALYIQQYAHAVASPHCDVTARKDAIRKVAALCCAAMIEHGEELRPVGELMQAAAPDLTAALAGSDMMSLEDFARELSEKVTQKIDIEKTFEDALEDSLDGVDMSPGGSQ